MWSYKCPQVVIRAILDWRELTDWLNLTALHYKGWPWDGEGKFEAIWILGRSCKGFLTKFSLRYIDIKISEPVVSSLDVSSIWIISACAYATKKGQFWQLLQSVIGCQTKVKNPNQLRIVGGWGSDLVSEANLSNWPASAFPLLNAYVCIHVYIETLALLHLSNC